MMDIFGRTRASSYRFTDPACCAQAFLWTALLPTSLSLQGQSVIALPVSNQPSSALNELSAETIFRRDASRILFITCEESADDIGLASGVLVSEDGFFVTNAHVTEGCRSMTATHIHGAARQSYVPVLKYYDEKNDIAVLKIAGRGFDFFPVVNRSARVGERVYAIGNPRGLEQSISEGIVSGNRELEGTPWIQHSAPISPGSSGGALISSRGELLGVNSRFRIESQNLNFAVPGSTVALALSSARAVTGSISFPPSADQQFSTGLLYTRGQGVPVDYVEAVKWIRQAAEKGHAEAQATLGTAYMEGKGAKLDYVEALRWFRLSAAQGNSDGQLGLGVLYSKGTGVTKDDVQAATFFRQASEQGNTLAQTALGVCLTEGRGIPKDEVAGAKLFSLAAEKGFPGAQFALALAYQIGRGVSRDSGESYFWYRIASGSEVPNAAPDEIQSRLNTVRGQLSADSLATEEERARQWLAQHPAPVDWLADHPE